MTTTTEPRTAPPTTSSGGDVRDPTAPDRRRARRRTAWAAGLLALAAAVAVIVAVIVAVSDDDGRAADDPGTAPLQLSIDGADALASCLVFDVAVLAEMSPAFAATATSVGGDETIVLRVDRWYAGDTGADVVEILAPSGLEGLIGGFPFVVDEQYLITATDGTVNFCGYSGPATPELTAAFGAAFG